MAKNDSFRLALTSEKLRLTYEVWQDLRGDRIGPKRDEIAPARLRAVLSSAYTIDVVDGGKDFRFRFAGERIIQFMGRRYAGTLLSEKHGSVFFDNMARMFTRCVTTIQPVSAGPVQASLQGKEFLEIEALVLPLSDDGLTVTGLFGAFDSWQLGTHKSAG
jgi:hypothetical protein